MTHQIDEAVVPPPYKNRKRFSSEEYEMKAEAMMLGIQTRMIKDYGLREVWIPEPEKEFDFHYPKCNIFMSKEFYKPSPE